MIQNCDRNFATISHSVLQIYLDHPRIMSTSIQAQILSKRMLLKQMDTKPESHSHWASVFAMNQPFYSKTVK